MEGDEVQTFGIEPKIWTMTTMSLAEKKSKFREMELKHEVNKISRLFKVTFIRRGAHAEAGFKKKPIISCRKSFNRS